MSEKKGIVFIDIAYLGNEDISNVNTDIILKFYDFFNNSNINNLYFYRFLGDRVMIILNEYRINYILDGVKKIKARFDEIKKNYSEYVNDLQLKIGISVDNISHQKGIIYNTQFDYISPAINRASSLCSIASKPYGIAIDVKDVSDIEEYNITGSSYLISKIAFTLEVDGKTRGKRCYYLVEEIEEERLGIKEVHLTGFIFNKKGQLFLEKRTNNEEYGANKYSTPGGRLSQAIPLPDALHCKILNESKINIHNIHVLDTYFINKFKAPGISFYAEVNEDKSNNKYFDENEVHNLINNRDLIDNISESVINKAFNYNKIYGHTNYRIRIVLPHNCNFACRNCHKEHVAHNTIFDFDKIKNVVLNIKNANCELTHVTITGGEPFHPDNYKHLIDVLIWLRSDYGYDLKISIVTNSWLISDDILMGIKKFNVSLKISIYSTNTKTNENIKYFKIYKDNKYSSINSFEYISTMIDKLRLIENHKISKSLNILLIKEENGEYLVDFIKCLKDNNIKLDNIKLMEQIRINENKTEEIVLFENIDLYKQKIESISDSELFFNTKKNLKYFGFNILFFKYPCNNRNNCSKCFNKWDLILCSNGQLQVCSNAINPIFFNNRLDRIKNLKLIDYAKLYIDNINQ